MRQTPSLWVTRGNPREVFALDCRYVGPVNIKDENGAWDRTKTQEGNKDYPEGNCRAGGDKQLPYFFQGLSLDQLPLLQRQGTAEGTFFCRGTFSSVSPSHLEGLLIERKTRSPECLRKMESCRGWETIAHYRCLYWSTNALKQEIYLKTACGHKVNATLWQPGLMDALLMTAIII